MDNRVKICIKYYLPALIWAGVIFFFSGIADLKVGASTISVEVILRKAAHFGEYAILAWLIFRVFYIGHNYTLRDSFILAVAFSGAYAISDEIHQTFILGRAGKAIDVAVDLLSATLGLSLVSLFYEAKVSLKRILLVFFAAFALLITLFFVVQEAELSNNQKNLEEATRAKNEASEKYLETQNKTNETSNNSQPASVPVEKKPDPIKTDLPQTIKIKVPFTSQAPLANWDNFHEEACEEASIIMVKHFLDNKPLDPQSADKEIMSMVNFEIKNYGDYKDSTAVQMVKLTQDFYGDLPGGKKLKVIYDIKREDLKNYLAKGNPIIIPAAGRLLGNPNYTAPGPPYHVLVATGYDGNTIITNDPGTRKGQDYRYNIDIFYNAIHDFPGSLDRMEEGRKAIIVVE